MLNERWFVVVECHHLLVLGRARLTTFLPYPKRKNQSASTQEKQGARKYSYAQERADGCDDHPRSDKPEDNGQLAIGQEAREGRHALRIRVDEREPAVGELHRGAREVIRVEAVLREARLAERRARQGRARIEARAVDGSALRALAEVRVRRVGAGHEAADHVRVDLIEEELRVDLRVVDFERAGTAVFCT